MGTGDHNAGGQPCDGLASHPVGSSNIPSRFMLRKPELSAGLMGHLARIQALPTASALPKIAKIIIDVKCSNTINF